MSYVDARIDNSARIKSALVVGSIHAALGLALVVGLTVSGVMPEIDETLEGTLIETPPEKMPVPPPPPTDDLIEPPAQPPVAPQNPFKFEDNTPIEVQPFENKFDDVIVVKLPPSTGEIIKPYQPPAQPRFTPKLAAPRNGPQGWITNDDYPSIEVRRGNEGMASYRLAIGTDGKVNACEIIRSSGHARLDQATCQLLAKRAKFDPATNGDGAKIAGSYSGSVTWQIPE